MANRVLIAEDDRAVRESLARALTLEGYEVEAVNDGASALDTISRSTPDLIILDLMMPNVDGVTVCRRIRSAGDRTPVLMVTARTEISDRVLGLDAGADDYLPKPFALDEMLARVRALLRRFEVPEPDETIRVADLSIDVAAHRVWRNDKELDLTKTEFELLVLLARNKGIVLTHSTIYEEIWGYDFGPESKSLAVYVGYLRRKLEDSEESRLIHTVRGVGYTLREP